MSFETRIQDSVIQYIIDNFKQEIRSEEVLLQETRKEFPGEFTVVVFPYTKMSKRSPEQTGTELGEFLRSELDFVKDFNVVKGFLNLELTDLAMIGFLTEAADDDAYGRAKPSGEKIVLEYTGPNTNKPLHLGHIRNMLLGFSVGEILKANGHDVSKVNIYNDRGIAICKSNVAWLNQGNGETPESSGVKGDHLVGKYYVAYDKEYRSQVAALQAQGKTEDVAKKEAPIYQQAQEMLVKWEDGDEETLALWRTMNEWVYKGFEKTYDRLGIDFDNAYYESEHYLSGKDMVTQGLDKGIFFQKEDGSIWVDLSDEGLDEKVLVRSDGTSVYLTQDIGVAAQRYTDYKMDRSIYVVGDEQIYHFKVLKLCLQKLGMPYAEGIFHLAYGMVDLPGGAKMKSREGTTVDADDLIEQMYQNAKEQTTELGKLDDMESEEAHELFEMVGLGALKFFILKVNPKKRMLFDPQESIDLQGFTGPFIQYTYARIMAVLRKAGQVDKSKIGSMEMNELERQLAYQIYLLPKVIRTAGDNYDPSEIANYGFHLAKMFNRFYQEHPILNADSEQQIALRLLMAEMVAKVLKESMRLLGIQLPNRM